MTLINNAYVVPPPAGSRPYEPDRLGLQASEVWSPGQTDQRAIVDAALNGAGAWRVTVVGDVVLQLAWGSNGNRREVEVDAPLVGVFAGQVTITARPREAESGAWATATLAPSWGNDRHDVRLFVAGALAVPPVWSWYQALAASVVSVRGTSVNLAPGERLPLVSGSQVVSGAGYLELTP